LLLELARHVDYVVAALRVADEHQRTRCAGGTIARDLVGGCFPFEMADRLGLDAFCTQVFGHLVDPRREHAKPAAQ
jgi:hypothetical protein